MLNFILKRIGQGIWLVFVISILIFMLLHMMPGDPIDMISGEKVTEEQKDIIRVKYGLDKPLYEQYGMWLLNVTKGDFGQSIKTKQSVNEMLIDKIPLTLKIVGLALALEFLIAVPLGLLAAHKKDTYIDKGLVIMTTIMGAIPIFWLAILFILIFSVKLKILPMSGISDYKSYILPVAAITLNALTGTLRLTRSEVLEIYREKYILTAYAKGLKTRAVLFKHVLRNALIPVVVMFFLYLPWLIGGSVIIENIFSIPGMGRLLWTAISTQDFPVVQACIFIISVLTVMSNIAGDIITGILDPRVRNALGGNQ